MWLLIYAWVDYLMEQEKNQLISQRANEAFWEAWSEKHAPPPDQQLDEQ